MKTRGKILLVDDEESVLLTLDAVLRREGYEVKAVGGGGEALRALQSESFDLLLSDLRIDDDVDGLTLLAAAQKRDPEVVTILLTGYASLESAVQALRHGAFNYLLKPCNLDEMKLTIARGLEKKRLAEALRDRVGELEEANRTIQAFTAELESRVSEATAELGERVRELQESRGRLSAVIDSMKDGLVVYDSEGRVTRANHFMTTLFGAQSDQLDGRGPADLAALTGEPVLDLANEQKQGYRAEAAVFEVEGPRKRFLRRIVSPVSGVGELGQEVVVIYQDITEQKEVEQLKDDFLSIASHELKTPLTSIMGYTQLLSRRLGPADEQASSQEAVEVIEAQCRRMKRLIEDLLDVSRIERGTLETARAAVDLPRLVGEVLTRFEGSSPKHDIRLTCLGKDILVWGDEGRLDQALSNLVSNALKYSPDGGVVDIAIRRDEETAEVAITDRGVGIPKEQLARIFSRFYQGETVVRSRRFGGMGLGLFITKAIVDELGGAISVDSAVGRGSTFRFTLPLYQG